jgi:Ca2+-binding RTX toxin-like protein
MDILGTAGNDNLTGTAGDDVLNPVTGAFDTVAGGAGIDTLKLDYSANQVSAIYVSQGGIQLGFLSGDATNGYLGSVSVRSGDTTDTVNFSGIERFDITGTRYDDRLFGGALGDRLFGGAGNDTFTPGLGNDVIDGGEGVDTLSSVDLSAFTTGAVFNFAAGGAITLPTGAQVTGVEQLKDFVGTAGNDTIATGNGDDKFSGGAGDDILKPGLGIDEVDGGLGNDLLELDYSSVVTEGEFTVKGVAPSLSYGSDGLGAVGFVSVNRTVNGVLVNDKLQFRGIERLNLTGTRYADRITGTLGNDVLKGGGGDDVFVASAGLDSIDGGEGTDTLEGLDLGTLSTGLTLDWSSGTVTLPGGSTATVEQMTGLLGTLGNDSFTGGAGNDSFSGGAGNDVLNGGAGDDVLNGGTGTDTVVGGEGSDALEIDYGLYDANQILLGTAPTLTGTSYSGTYSGRRTVGGAQVTDAVTFSGIERFNIAGTRFADTFAGGVGNDVLRGNAGNDTLSGNEGNDTLIGVATYSATPGAGEIDTLTGGAGKDEFWLGTATKSFYTVAGNDDYAIITDFNRLDDVIRLKGAKDGYRLDSNGALGVAGTAIYGRNSVSGTDDLVAIVKDVTGLSLDSLAFGQGKFDADAPKGSFSLTFDSTSLTEGLATSEITATITRINADNSAALRVDLLNPDDRQLTLPIGGVTIAAGQDSATFKIKAFNDTVAENPTTYQITASALDFRSIISGAITITDDDGAVVPPPVIPTPPAPPVNPITQIDPVIRAVVQSANLEQSVSQGLQDFNGDGKGDAFFYNQQSGETKVALTAGTTATQKAVYRVGDAANWKVAGIGDISGDAQADVIWREQRTGMVASWTMNGEVITAGRNILAVGDMNWKILGLGDTNGDRTSDIAWRNESTGDTAIWTMQNGQIQSGTVVARITDLNWKVVGIADFNGDGKSDFAWRHQTTGENAIWLMDGTSIAKGAFLLSVSDNNWQVAATGDLNSDGKADLFWINKNTGENAVWLMDGTSFKSGRFGTSLNGAGWQVAKVADVNGDGNNDVVLRNANSGSTKVWSLTALKQNPLDLTYAPVDITASVLN